MSEFQSGSPPEIRLQREAAEDARHSDGDDGESAFWAYDRHAGPNASAGWYLSQEWWRIDDMEYWAGRDEGSYTSPDDLNLTLRVIEQESARGIGTA